MNLWPRERARACEGASEGARARAGRRRRRAALSDTRRSTRTPHAARTRSAAEAASSECEGSFALVAAEQGSAKQQTGQASGGTAGVERWARSGSAKEERRGRGRAATNTNTQSVGGGELALLYAAARCRAWDLPPPLLLVSSPSLPSAAHTAPTPVLYSLSRYLSCPRRQPPPSPRSDPSLSPACVSR